MNKKTMYPSNRVDETIAIDICRSEHKVSNCPCSDCTETYLSLVNSTEDNPTY